MQKPFPSRALQLVVVAVATTAIMLCSPMLSGRAAASGRGSWAFSAIDVPNQRPTGEGVRVAIVDSGIDPHHPAFAGRIDAAVDCIDSDHGPAGCRDGAIDDSGHGTHIAGIVAARAVKGGPEGIAPAARLLVARTLRNTCEPTDGGEECRALGQLEDVVAGVRWATRQGAQLINLSIDAGVDLNWKDGTLTKAIRDAWDAGAVVVASTGNGAKQIDDPALERVPLLLVGAVGPEGDLASYSNTAASARWTLLAPGGEAGGECPEAGVLSTYPTEIEAAGTGCLSGTSMAAAYVTGALASVIGSGVEPHQALLQLVATAQSTPVGPLVDLDAALSAPADAIAAQAAEADLAPAEDESTAGQWWQPLMSLDQWTDVHPLRTRALGVAAALVGVMLMLTSRRRPRFSVSYY